MESLLVESFDGQSDNYAKQKKPGVWRTSTQGGEGSLVLEFPPAGLWTDWALCEDGIYYIYHQDTLGNTATSNEQPAKIPLVFQTKNRYPFVTAKIGLTRESSGQ
jgi:hypothetical protein